MGLWKRGRGVKASVAVAAAAAALVAGLVAGVGVSAAGFDSFGCSPTNIRYVFDGLILPVQPGDVAEGDPEVMVCDGTTYMPLRYVARNLGATVLWDPGKRMVSIDTGPCHVDGGSVSPGGGSTPTGTSSAVAPAASAP
jgi:hypothetical protein